MELSHEEQRLLAIFRALDDCDKKELLRHASLQQKADDFTGNSIVYQSGQCRLARGEERPERIAEPIFTE